MEMQLTISYQYDSLNQLVKETLLDGTTISYNDNGDKVIYETDENNNVVGQYTWDNQGNPVSIIKAAQYGFRKVTTSINSLNKSFFYHYGYKEW